MAGSWLSRITREHSPLLHYVGALSDRLLDWRSVLLSARVRVCGRNCTERTGSLVRLTRVPSIPRRQAPGGHRWLVTGCIRFGARSATSGNDVADLCSGGISRASGISCLQPLHSASGG